MEFPTNATPRTDTSSTPVAGVPESALGKAVIMDRDPAVLPDIGKASRVPLGELGRRYALIPVWLGTIVLFSILRPDTFATLTNVRTIAGSQAVLVIIVLGLLVPLTVGEYDLSISGVSGLALVMIGYLNVLKGWDVWTTVALALAMGLAVGVINAFFVVVADVNSFIVTLGTGTTLTGIAIGVNSQSTGGISQSLVRLTQSQFLTIPLGFYYGLGLCIVLWYVLDHTALGRHLYFVGAGRNVARLAGVRVNRLRAGSLIVSALSAAVGGVALASWLGASDPNVASSYLLPAFAAAFLGSAAIRPGRFNAWGALIAIYFLISGVTGLELIGYAGWVEQVFYGAMLVIAVALSRLGATRGA